MSNNIIIFSDEEKEIMKDIILKCFQNLLPQIVNEITPLILQHSQEIIVERRKYDKNTVIGDKKSVKSAKVNVKEMDGESKQYYNGNDNISKIVSNNNINKIASNNGNNNNNNGNNDVNNNGNNFGNNFVDNAITNVKNKVKSNVNNDGNKNGNYFKSDTKNKEKSYNNEDYTPFENERLKTQYPDTKIDESELAEGLRLISVRPNFWSVLLDTREDRFYKYTRDEMLSNLFREGLEENPIYVPQTLLEKEGKNIENNDELKLKWLMLEIDTLEIRCKNLKRELNAIDQKIIMEIRNLSSKKRVVYAVMCDMEEKIKRSNKRIQEQWTAEIDRLRKSFKEEREKANAGPTPEERIEAAGDETDELEQDGSQDSGSTISTDVVPLNALKSDDSFEFDDVNNEPIVKDIEKWTNEINRMRENYKSKRERFKKRVTSSSSVEDLSKIKNFGFNANNRRRFSNFETRYGLMSNPTTEWYDEEDYETAYMKLINKMRGNCNELNSLKDSSEPFLNIKQPLRYSVLRPFRS